MAPKRVENTLGELVEEIPPPYKTTEGTLIEDKTGLVQLPRTAEPVHSLGKLERVFNFTGGQRATLAPPQLQWLHPSSNHTPLVAVY